MILTLEGDAPAALAVLEGPDLPDHPNVSLYAAAARSLATTDEGDLIEGERLAQASLARAEAWGLASSMVAGSLWLALGAPSTSKASRGTRSLRSNAPLSSGGFRAQSTERRS